MYFCIMEWIRKYREEKLRKSQEYHDRQVEILTEFLILRIRLKAGGDRGIHLLKHDPPSEKG